MLTIQQKSIYLVLLNATMILRSIGKSLKNKEKLKQFKILTFKQIEFLAKKIDDGNLKEQHILTSIREIVDSCNISFGQAQKAINVLLKYHFYLNKHKDDNLKNVLDCPLDSKILKKLQIKKSLTKINEEDYIEIQKIISQQGQSKLDYDLFWDRQNLEGDGLL